MIDPKHVLELADRWVEANDRYSAAPSTDPMMRGLVEAIVAKVNAELGQIAAGMLEVLALVPAAVSGELEAPAYNYAVHELAKMLGAVQPTPAAPPASGPSPGQSNT